MGTRSLTVFKDEDGKEIVVLYRQFDGYPEGHGKDLAGFLKGKRVVNGFSPADADGKAFNGAGCLAAWTVGHFKGGKIGNFYLYPAGTRDCGEDYIYTVYLRPMDKSVIGLKVESFGNTVLFDGPVNDFKHEACKAEQES